MSASISGGFPMRSASSRPTTTPTQEQQKNGTVAVGGCVSGLSILDGIECSCGTSGDERLNPLVTDVGFNQRRLPHALGE
jgi:hypothetical protein